jgi:phage virion morphogenesis protein
MIEAKLQYEAPIRALRRAAAEMGNTRPLMRSVAGIMLRAVEDNFEQEGRPKWKDLLPSTKLGRYKEGTWPGKILQRSGSLAASIQQAFDSNSAIVGTNKAYGAIHQFGGKTEPHVIKARNKRALSFAGIVVTSVNHPGSDIPARPYLRLTPADYRDIMIAAREHHNRALARNGLQSS